ncbi:uncharacterized protein LOC129752834 [Uranotaenia lowii]|uniref:uncharacterized protein LOC129752834 n=1 Tax=Uranotaenia lowii TaxID=190385 RepID=UPI00247B245B|nr:uncharacterized protein LOC129752834 [Uranotaenia lowii]
MSRFLSLERRLSAKAELKALYADFIHEFVSMGHMKEVSDDVSVDMCQNAVGMSPNIVRMRQKNVQNVSELDPVYYLPHHEVLKPESTTTKLRVVFDASCRTSTGVSLNDALIVGPTVQNDLLSIILRFRLHRYAISADIEKMYRMVQVQQPDQHLQRILWRDTPDEPVKTFELTTVTYGTASAPYLATRCLKQLAEDGSASHPIGSRVVRDSFYVDDCLVGADSVEEGKHLVEETTDLTNSAGFNLRKFNSNSPEILASIPEDLKEKKSVLEFDSSDSTVKTLGLKWDTESDNFCFSIPHWRSSSSQITKRSVHSDAACLFDPLGLVGPVVVQAKMIIQQLWRLKVGWDDPLDEQYQNRWKEYKQSLMPLESLSVPRWLGFSKDCVSVQLHGFCDASEVAYGACLYLRCVTVDGQISVRLVTAKSRVAPLENLKRSKRKTSIPRLELSSALQLSHLYEKFARVFPEVTEAYFWTDSMIVKHWLASHPSRWQMFVANRVSEIQHITRNGFWNHVAGIVNPADLISRGVSPARLCYERLWFEGPQWLSQAQQYWPRQTAEGQEEFDPSIIEERPTTTTLMSKCEPCHEIFGLKSSFTSLIRIVAVMLRFRYNAQKVNRLCRRVGPLTPQEMESAIVVLVRLSQNESFESEFKDLENNGQVEKRSKIAKLNPFVEDGTIRVGGRLSNAPLPDSRKHPWVLDHRHPLALLIVRDYHLRQFHAGQQLLIASVRRSFWPTNINSLARKVIHECVPCFRSRPKISEQIMSDLPSVRVTPSSAFSKVGVDYCGPFNVSYPNRRASPVKCYVAIFVCLAVKAVHLELVMDLTTEAFISAFRRFVGRRSKPELIMCDNATTFVGANNSLKEIGRLMSSKDFQNTVTKAAADEGVEFRFIPPRSPNFGGLWEAQVKSFKAHFRKTIGLRTLSVDEMVTALVQIEAVLNSRPLTPQSSDPNDFEVLTPGHFLVQRPLTALPERDVSTIPIGRLTMWQKAQQVSQQFWNTWRNQYLSNLQNRTRWIVKRKNVAPGMMVLLKEDNIPPLKWPLGRIDEVFFGRDGNVRVVNVRTKDGMFNRGISKVCLLPIRENEAEGSDEIVEISE